MEHLSEFAQIAEDPAHWGFEALSDLVYGFLLYPALRYVVRRHDRKKHSEPVSIEFIQEMFRVQSALVDHKIDRLAGKVRDLSK
jgi:hypothetical protein